MAEASPLPTLTTPKELGKQLRSVRRGKGLSLSEVARGAGLSRRELVSYERGKVPIPESDLWVLAGSCGVDVAELMPPTEVPQLPAVPSTIEDTVSQLRSRHDVSGLNRHLDTLYALRALPAGSPVQLQEPEREAIAEALGRDPKTLESRLMTTMRVSSDDAARLSALILPPILPPTPQYSPLALEAPVAAHAPEPTFAEEAPSAPVDVFEELARLPEPVPLPDPRTEDNDLLSAPPEPVGITSGSNAAEHGSFAEWQSFRSALRDPIAPALVEAPATASTTMNGFGAGDAPPIDVAGRIDAVDWTGAASDVSTLSPSTRHGDDHTDTTDEFPPRAPSSWDSTWTTATEPTNHEPSPVELVEFVDEYVEELVEEPVIVETTSVDEIGAEPTPEADVTGDSSGNGTRPWDHQPDPEATSTGFYVDWGTPDEAAPEPASPIAEPTTVTDIDPGWDPTPLATWDVPGATWDTESPVFAEADASPGDEPDADGGGGEGPDAAPELAPISWRPLPDHRTGHEERDADSTSLLAAWDDHGTAAPEIEPTPEPAPDSHPDLDPAEAFVVAGSEWDLGNAVPLVEIRGQGGLVMRRADERWALADVTTPPSFAVEVEIDFRAGPGFGVLFRASTDEAGHMSGYSFDIDPIYEGGSYLVRQWHADRELWNPLACVPAPDPSGMHGVLTVRIVVLGDRMSASVNGEELVAVESLKQACADRNREPPEGDRVGIQAWSSTDLVIDTLRVAER